MLGGAKVVEPLSSAKPAMKVWLNTCEKSLPNTSLRSGSSVVCTPTGIGKVRGSYTESEMRLATKNQSSPSSPRNLGVRHLALP
jgi:hypothetical protein